MFVDLIDRRVKDDRRFQASLHGMSLAGDDVVSGRSHNRSHAALERMKARRARRRG